MPLKFDTALTASSSFLCSLFVVAVMTERIRGMTKHLKVHPKDKDTERSIVKLVHKRRGMMQYLLRQSPGTLSWHFQIPQILQMSKNITRYLLRYFACVN